LRGSIKRNHHPSAIAENQSFVFKASSNKYLLIYAYKSAARSSAAPTSFSKLTGARCRSCARGLGRPLSGASSSATGRPGGRDFTEGTSDHPVALYNEYLQESSSQRGTTGAAASGLQIFLPLSPNLCVLLFDGDVYRVLPRRRGGLPRATENDLAQINRLQVVEAENCLYFHPATDEHLIHLAVASGTPLRDTVGPRVVEAVSEEDERHSLLHQYRATANMNLSLSFLKLSQSARNSDRSASLVPYRPAAAAVLEHQERLLGPARSRSHGMTFRVKTRI
jgi:hypothetical protein